MGPTRHLSKTPGSPTGDDAGDDHRSGVLLADGGMRPEDFVIDPRSFNPNRSPAVLEERLADGDTSRVSFGDFELHESGAVMFTQYDGRQGVLPQWRWTDIELLETESFTDEEKNKRRRRVTEADWDLLPKRVRDVFDPTSQELATDGGTEAREYPDLRFHQLTDEQLERLKRGLDVKIGATTGMDLDGMGKSRTIRVSPPESVIEEYHE